MPKPEPMSHTNNPPLAAETIWTLERRTAFWVYWSLLAALFGGFIWGQRSHLSPNDRSRWNTVWSLVEFGTYQIFDTEEEAKKYDKPVQLPTIDKVYIDGKFYSSKPPLLPTVIAGWVWILKPFVGEPFANDARTADGQTKPGSIHVYAKATLYLFQFVPFLCLLVLYRRYLDGYSRTDFAWGMGLAAAGLGTLTAGYLGTLNNHVIAAWSGFVTAYQLVRIWYEHERQWWRFLLAGLFAGWTAANELPAGLLVIMAIVIAVLADWRKTIAFFLPPLAVVTAAFFYTNWMVVGTIKPAYTQKEWYEYPGSHFVPGAPGRSAIDSLNDPEKRENSAVYFVHMTIGHHGWFSLIPIWFFALWGGARSLRGRDAGPAGLAWPVFAVSAGVFLFFWLVADQRNYGGYCHGMRWLIWLEPLWLLLLPIGLDQSAANPKLRRLAAACLLVSVFSMADTLCVPWSYSWLHRVLRYFGIVGY
jgi:hypothetical protein